MMKCAVAFLTGVFVLFGFKADAQKLKTERYDAAAKKWQMETFAVNLKSGADAKTNVAVLAVDTTLTLLLSGSGIGTSTVDLGSELIFLLENDSTVVAKSTAIQGIDFDNLVSSYRHQYTLSTAALRALSRHQVKALRKFSAGGVDVIPLEKKNAWKVSEISTLLVAKLKEKKLWPENTPIMPPGFPGGRDVFARFLNRNLKQLSDIPNGARRSTVVVLRFAADGTTSDVQLTSSLGASIDNELIRLLQRMPKWKPATRNGTPTTYSLSLPVTFIRTNDSLRIEL